MMSTDHPITPPPELVRQWVAKNYVDLPIEHVEVHLDDVKICTEAARWGADQELEACCGLIGSAYVRDQVRAARRPQAPPSLKEQALEAWDRLKNEAWCEEIDGDLDFVRRALEQLND